MDFEFFQKLTQSEADEFLEKYLALESTHIVPMLEQCRKEGIDCDYSVNSVPAMFRWVLRQLSTFPRSPDSSLPDWIRQSETYVKYLFEFNEPSKILILRASYYLGASFVHEFGSLRWATGNKDRLEANMPVVIGFKHDIEMATMMVTENLFGRITADPERANDIDVAIERWRSFVPER